MLAADPPPPCDDERDRREFKRALVIGLATAAVGPAIRACGQLVHGYLERKHKRDDSSEGKDT